MYKQLLNVYILIRNLSFQFNLWIKDDKEHMCYR